VLANNLSMLAHELSVLAHELALALLLKIRVHTRHFLMLLNVSVFCLDLQVSLSSVSLASELFSSAASQR